MKRFSEILTLVAAAALAAGAGVLPAAAADRRPADATQPSYQYTPGRTERPPQSSVHADYHADYRVKTGGETDRGDRTDERVRDERRQRDRDRWSPGAERYTRPPHQWSR